MRDFAEDAGIIGLIVVAACGSAFVIGVAAGLFRLGMGLVS